MGWFKTYASNKIDDEILEHYLEIEVLVGDIGSQFDEYFRHINDIQYYIHNRKDSTYYSLHKIHSFFQKIKEEYAYCYTIREHKKMYEFHKNSSSRGLKIEIIITLEKMTHLLKEIHSYTQKLSKTSISSNDFSELVRFVEKFFAREKQLLKIQKNDQLVVEDLLCKVKAESAENEHKGLWLVSQKDGTTKLHFSQTIAMNTLRYLDLVPLLEMAGLRKRSVFINELHKDKVLPLHHYNVDIDGVNIHVVPRGLHKKLQKFLLAA